MTINPALLVASSQLAAAEASIGGPSAPSHWLIKRAVFTNTDTSARSVTVYRVPSGGAAGTGNIVFSAHVVNIAGTSGDTYVAPELTDMVLNPGDTLHAFADSANKVNVTISGFTY